MSSDIPKPAPRTDRFGAEFIFDPCSLVGSYFLAGPTPGWAGQILAEPSPGVYLVEFFEWLGGTSDSQGLVRLEQMFEEGTQWKFFDDAEWMWDDYNHGTGQRWKDKRESAESNGAVR